MLLLRGALGFPTDLVEEQKETYGRSKWLWHFSIQPAASGSVGGKLSPIDSNARINRKQ